MNEHEQSTNTLTTQAETIFFNSLEMASSKERMAYIEQACADDTELRTTIERMLSTRDEADAFFSNETPTRISAVEISQTLADIPEFFEKMTHPFPDDDEVGKEIGNYKLLQKIGEGGGGTVYLAEQLRPVRRQVAFKIIKLGMDTKSVIARFEAERQALAMMEHPNIAHVLNAGETETGRPFFVMELVDGLRITTYCDDNALDLRKRLELFIQICHAIQHAHQKGIIHRDIKPSNVLITLHDNIPMPKVIDFGIAKATKGDRLVDETSHTSAEPFVGTPAYMSPEQADAAHTDIDMRSDIYSLGALLYELLCGKPPFDQKELMKSGLDAMRRTLRDQEPPRPSAMFQSMAPDEQLKTAKRRQLEPRRLIAMLGSELDWIVMRALDKSRERRYQSADGLAEDVLRYLNEEPVTARPPSRRYRFQKLVRRNKGVFASISAISLALVAGFGTSSWLFVKERAAREAMERARQSEAVLRLEAETREKITKSAVLLNHDRFEEADELMRDCEIPVIKPSLEASDVFFELAYWHVSNGRLSQASDYLLKLALANRVDQSDMSDSATRVLLRVAPALVAAHDYDNYRALISDAISHFSGTTNPVAAEQIIKVSIIRPLDDATKSALMPMADVVASSVRAGNPESNWEIYLFSWRAFALAWYAYRCGDYDDAVSWARQCLDYPDTTPTKLVMIHSLLAMAYHHFDQKDDALFDLALARALLENRYPDGLSGMRELGDQKKGFWHDWIMAHLLLEEATALVQAAAPAE